MLIEETVSVTWNTITRSFVCSNKKCVNGTDAFMSNPEYADHKASQTAAMLQLLKDAEAEATRTTTLNQRRTYIASLVADLEAGTAMPRDIQRALAVLIRRELGT